MKDLYNKEARIKYSKLYFETISTLFPVYKYAALIKLERDGSRKELHTHEYWWIKYKMAKTYEKRNGRYCDEKTFFWNNKKYKACQAYANKIVMIYYPDKDYLEDFIALDIYLHYSWDGTKLYDPSTGLPFSTFLYRFQRDNKSEILSSPAQSQSKENPVIISLPFIGAFTQLLNEGSYDESIINAEEKNIINHLIEKYDLLNGKTNYYKSLFNTYYSSKNVPIEFEYAYGKYGEALFDFLGLFKAYETNYSYQLNNDAVLDLLIDYFIEKIFKVIRSYESIFKAEIIINSGSYWEHLKKVLNNHFKQGHDLEDDWWIDNLGVSLSSKITLVPHSAFEDINYRLGCVQMFKKEVSKS